MPELPEVEVVRSGLEPAVTGARIAAVEVFDDRSLKRHSRAEGEFAAILEGATIRAAVRRGKFLWLPLDDDRALLAHLGMSGQVLLRTAESEPDKLLRIRIELEHPLHGSLRMHFVDQRIFGSMAVDRLRPTIDGFAGGFAGRFSDPAAPPARDGWFTKVPGQVAHIARDPLDEHFDVDAFVRALSKRSSGIKRVMLDQNLVSGIGNIYADESLWAAEVHYDQPASSLGDARIHRLLAEIRSVLERALAEGGTSFDAQYVNVNGASGYFSHSLNAYGQQGKPCPRCGTLIVRESFMNRGSHFCPRCQRKPVALSD